MSLNFLFKEASIQQTELA